MSEILNDPKRYRNFRRYIDDIKKEQQVANNRGKIIDYFTNIYASNCYEFIKNELYSKEEFNALHFEWAKEIDRQIADNNMARIVIYGVNGCGKSYFLQKLIIWLVACHDRAAGMLMSTIIKQVTNLSNDLGKLLEDSKLTGLVDLHDNAIYGKTSKINVRANYALNEAAIKGIHSIGDGKAGMAALLIDEGSGINNTSYKAMFGNLSQGDVPTVWVICSNPEMTIESSVLEKIIRYPEEAPQKFKTFKITADMCPNLSETYIEMGNYLFGESFGRVIGEGELTFGRRLLDFDALQEKNTKWKEKYGESRTLDSQKTTMTRVMGIDIGGKIRAFHAICVRDGNKVVFWDKFQQDKVEFATTIDNLYHKYVPDYSFYDNQGDELYNSLCKTPIIPFKSVRLPKESGYFCKRCEALDQLATWLMRDDTEIFLEQNDMIYLSRLKYETDYDNVVRITPKNKISDDCQSGKDRVDALMYTFVMELESSETKYMSEFIHKFNNRNNYRKLLARQSEAKKYGY